MKAAKVKRNQREGDRLTVHEKEMN